MCFNSSRDIWFLVMDVAFKFKNVFKERKQGTIGCQKCGEVELL